MSRRKKTVIVDEGADLLDRQDGLAVDQDDVKSDAQSRIRLRTGHGVVRRGGADHQARGVEHAALMRDFDRLVHFQGCSKVIGRYDQSAL